MLLSEYEDSRLTSWASMPPPPCTPRSIWSASMLWRLPFFRGVAAEVGAAEVVAARLADELGLDTGGRCFGRERGGIDLHFLHRADIRIVAERAGRLGGVDPLDAGTHLAGGPV